MSKSLFAAMPVSHDLSQQIGNLPQKSLNNARFLDKADLHITLRYIGRYMDDVENVSIEDIEEALSRVKRPPFEIVARNMGVFHLKRETILYAAIESARKLTALVAEINEKLQPLGFEMPNKPYVPHVTIARVKDSKGLDSYMKFHEKTISAQWRTNSFGFYTSADENEDNIRYKLLREYPLEG